MHESERQTRTYLMNLFGQHGFHPRTDLGQNFLIDLNLIEFVVRSADLGQDDVVLEVGAGTGGMTTALAAEAAAVVSVEIDRHMHQLASRAVESYPNVTLLNTDALKNKNRFSAEVVETVEARLQEVPGRRLKLVANLPYSVATPVISNLVATDLPWVRMVVTIQWELAERMNARPGTSDYSALSIWLQSQCRIEILKKLPPTVFWPRPRVDSAIVRIVPRAPGEVPIDNRPFLQDFLRRMFAHRRKLLRGVLVGMYRNELGKPDVDAALQELNLPADARAEQLEVTTLVELANRLHQRIARATGTASG